MNKILLPQNKNEVLKKTTQNLGIYQNAPGSYLSTVVEGLYDLNSKVTEEMNEVISDLYIETASSSTLENFGAKKGIPRLKNKTISVSSGDMNIFLKPIFYKENLGLTVKLFSKNQIIKADIFVITFLDDVIYNSNLDRVYISCTVALNPIYELPYDYIDSNTVFRLSIPKQHSALIEQITFEVEKDIYFSSYNETEIAYRDRLIKALRAQNISGESYIKSTLDSMPYIDQYYEAPKTYTTKLYLLNNLMYKNTDYDELIDEGTIALGTSLIDQVKTYGSNFELNPAERVTLIVDVEMGLSSNFLVHAYLKSFSEYIYNLHVLGKELLINKNILESFLKENSITDVQFNLKIYLYFNGISVLNDVEDSIIIKEHQYPTIFQVLYNGEDVNEL